MSFEISVDSYNSSQNTLRLINKFNKFISFFMENLIANFIQFLGLLTNFYFCKGDWALDYYALSFMILPRLSHFLSRLRIRVVTSTFSF